MRTSWSRIGLPTLAAMALVALAHAQVDDAPPVDAAPRDEKHVIEPGKEPLFAEMLGSGQTLPAGCTFADGKIERTTVVATYTCGSGQVVLQLVHPELAPPGGVRTQRFAVTVKSGTPPAGLVEAIADRIRAREAAFDWVTPEQTGGGTRRMRWVLLGGGSALAILAFWALRRRG